jgi:hypothetical protein
MNLKSLLLLLPLIIVGAGVSHAQNLIESYTTQLSEQDHFSSRGERLQNAAAIIRQDRANYHKFGRCDPGDQHDAFFASATNREALEDLINAGTSEPSAIRSIVNGTPMVRVSIFRSAPGRDFVNVEVADPAASEFSKLAPAPVVSAPGGQASSALPTEVPKGSKLRAALFDLARQTIEGQARQPVKFAGSLKQLNEWAFFIGQIVNAKGAPVYVLDSAETLLLWKQENGEWRFLAGETGCNEPFHLWEWPEKFGTPKELFK